ncbi:MAG: Uncharacterised protein [Flavobacteriia bacterium]|nr:MAG: Uncharacterised protein [Flavobacteriia bacterium]
MKEAPTQIGIYGTGLQEIREQEGVIARGVHQHIALLKEPFFRSSFFFEVLHHEAPFVGSFGKYDPLQVAVLHLYDAVFFQ